MGIPKASGTSRLVIYYLRLMLSVLSANPRVLLRSMRPYVQILAILMSVLAPTVANAEWVTVWVAESKDRSGWYNNWLVDVESLIGKDQTRRAWVLINMKTDAKVSSGNRRSVRMLWSIDCDEQRFRRLTFTAHRGAMGDGRVTAFDDRETNWEYAPPGTGAEATIKFACSVETDSRERQSAPRG